jgi:predicted regulator of Ras-like GTPase activity (Roadblock/LC7/MglB family)
MITEVLKGVLTKIDGAQCVLLAATDGVIVATALAPGGPAPDVVAASLADLFRRVASAHREAGLAPPAEFTTSGAGEQSAVRAVTGQYLLLAVLDGVASLGRTRFELRKAASVLQPELV